MQIRKGVGFPSTCKVVVVYRRPPCWKDPNHFYRLLGLTPNASDEEVRNAGRKLLARYHPDGPEPDEEKFLATEEAYRCLRDKRDEYDATPADHVMVTESNKESPKLVHMEPESRYNSWSYFSEVPRATDDSVAVWAYEQYLAPALKTPTTLPRIAVVLIQANGDPWIDDGLIYIPVSDIRGKMVATSEDHSEADRQG